MIVDSPDNVKKVPDGPVEGESLDSIVAPNIKDNGLVNRDLEAAIVNKSHGAAKREGVVDRVKGLKKWFYTHVEEKRIKNLEDVKEMERQMQDKEKSKTSIPLPSEKPVAAEPQLEKPEKIDFFPEANKAIGEMNTALKEGENPFFDDVVNRKPGDSI